MKTYRVLGLLMSYPTSDVQLHMDELKEALAADGLISSRRLGQLTKFMDALAASDLIEAQETYVGLFDRGRGQSLYLFEHIHGESRDRGPAMVDLTESYKEHGFMMSAGELPDYIPLFLEFLSLLPPDDAQDYLNEVIHIFATIGVKLQDKGSDYHVIFDVIQALASTKVAPEVLAQALEESQAADESFEALDKEWEEKPAFTGDPTQDIDADCRSCAATPSPFQSPQV